MAPQIGSGYIKGDGNGSFSSSFTLSNDVEKKFNGQFSSAIPKFTSNVAIVDFNNISDLSDDYEINENATVGPTTVNLPLINSSQVKITITGKINPFLPKAYTVTGFREWHSS